jgi:hypothetical protein
MEIEAATRRRLLGDSTVTGYVGDRVWPFRLEDRVDPHGHRAVVVYRGPAWAETDRYEAAAAEYPTLVVDCWADCTRDDSGEILRTDRVQAAFAVWRAVHRLLHNPPRGQMWGQVGSNPGLLVNTSTQWFGPTHLEGDGIKRTGIPLGDAAVVTATYALNVALVTA